MSLEPLDREAEKVMQRWGLPAVFVAAFMLCVALAGVAVMDRQWVAAGVLTAAAVVQASLADQARRAA